MFWGTKLSSSLRKINVPHDAPPLLNPPHLRSHSMNLRVSLGHLLGVVDCIPNRLRNGRSHMTSI